MNNPNGTIETSMQMLTFTRIYQQSEAATNDKQRPKGWYADLVNEFDFDLEAEQFAARRAQTG